MSHAQRFGWLCSIAAAACLACGIQAEGGAVPFAARGESQPITGQDLRLRATLELAADLGISPSSTFNPRYFDGDSYVNQINIGTMGFGRYPAGWPVALLLVDNSAAGPEHRMVAPFRGAHKAKYLIGSGSGAAGSKTISRYDFDGSNRVDVTIPFNITVEGFDWVDEDTIIGTSYTSGTRQNLYLFDVVADPFALTVNTAWNASGFITTPVTTRIRNVRAGDVYGGYAYFGDAGQATSPNFYALNLATGVATLLGDAGPLTGSGSFGLWTVLERGGLLYVQTTDDGIQVYQMTSATTLGALAAVYSKADLDLATGASGQYWGLDVSPDGTAMILGASSGQTFEIGPPRLGITDLTGTELTLAWPASVNDVLIQASPSLAPAAFADLEPQPTPWVDGNLNKASVTVWGTQGYFRLRNGP